MSKTFLQRLKEFYESKIQLKFFTGGRMTGKYQIIGLMAEQRRISTEALNPSLNSKSTSRLNAVSYRLDQLGIIEHSSNIIKPWNGEGGGFSGGGASGSY